MDENSHYTIYGYDVDRKPLYKAKKTFLTERDAVIRCFQINLAPHSIHKAVAYKCRKCGKWHIGHHKGVTLTETEREKIRIKFERFKVINNLK